MKEEAEEYLRQAEAESLENPWKKKDKEFNPDDEEKDINEAERLFPDFNINEPEKAMNFEAELRDFSQAFTDTYNLGDNDFSQEFRVARGEGVDLDESAMWKFQADAAYNSSNVFPYDIVGVPDEMRQENSSKDNFFEKADPVTLGLHDFTNRLRIYTAMSHLAGIEKARKKLRKVKSL